MSTTRQQILIPVLTELQCNQMEIEAFLSNLEIGPSPASDIAKVANRNRVAIYEALKRLSTKGLVRITANRKSKVRNFTPTDLQTIKRKLVAKKSNAEHAINSLEQAQQKLLEFYSGHPDRPTVLFQESLEGIRDALYDIIEQKPKELLAFSTYESFLEVFGMDWVEKYWEKRKSQGIVSRGIIPFSEAAKNFYNKERNTKDLRTIKFIPQEWYKFNDNINIYGNNVQIISLQPANEHSVIIRSKSIANAFRFLFDLVWNTVAQEK